MVNHKFWIVIYLQISFINLMREHATKKINDAYEAGRLTYKQRKIIKITIWAIGELINAFW